MNKKLIRDLAMTGGIYDCLTDPYDKLENGDHHSSVMVDLERFAELIVKECMKLNSKELSITAIERLLPLYEEHFGVEE